MLSFFPRDVLDEILNLIESVSEGFPSYSSILQVEKTAEAPSASNSFLASLRIATYWSAGSLTGGGTWSSRSVNCCPLGLGRGVLQEFL